MDLQDELKTLKGRIEEIEEQIKEEQAFPKNGDEYWCLGDWLLPTLLTYEDDYADRGRKKYGNVYKTKEEAEFAAEKLKVEAELRKFSRPFEDNENSYYIELYLPDKKLSIDRSEHFKTQGTIYFESKKVANEAIDTVGADRIKKNIFGVED